ncbi:MAG TPA: two-component sensor histidine kinase [Oscillatoriales bacterium UBA8482]|nr:MAG: two-component sensor histidine kinase [Oscillatoriales cyanobacterium CG2_30_40_61]HBW57703.1 two-component sensor histidine kinase [Oscillatoriales bacterium UBA8482]
MKLIHQFISVINPFIRKQISLSSLQFRLTLELVLLSILGLSSVAFWAGWQLSQNLIIAHKGTLEYISARFPEQVELYSEMGSIEVGLNRSVYKASTDGVMVWVKRNDGMLLVNSPGMDMQSTKITQMISLTKVPTYPSLIYISDRYLVICARTLTIKNNLVGTVYFSKDITLEKNQLNHSIRSLIWVSILVILLLMLAIASRIRHALRPLQQMSQVASTLSAEDLKAAKLELHQAPDEILGLAQTFNQMLLRLSDSWEQQRQFVGNVSHELRTPLTVVLGYLQSLLRRGTNFSDYQKQALETAIGETERTIRMLEDLLNLARADSGNLHFAVNPVVLNTLVAEVAAMSQNVSNRQIILISNDQQVVACADQNRLQQVLINLVDNAIKYSSPEQPVELKLEKTEKQAIIHICDRGIGISLAHQNRIFERFYRVDESMTRSRDGTGLGLAIAKSLIEGMEGHITLRSKPGEGSIFTIILPLWNP